MDSEERPPGGGERPRRSRWQRVLLWLVVVLVLLVVGAGVGWYQFGGKLRYTEPYRAAVALLEKDPQVLQQLGQPIKNVSVLGLVGGSVYGEGANLTFQIAGPKGRAAVRAEARKIAGQWAVRALEVTCADGKRISVNTSTGSAGDEAPAWPSAPSTTPPPAKETAEPTPKASAPSVPGPEIKLDLPDMEPNEKRPPEATPPQTKTPTK